MVGERNVVISCGFGPLIGSNSAFGGDVSLASVKHGQLAGEVRVQSADGVFDTNLVPARFFLSSRTKEQFKAVQCSSALFKMSGTQWVIEWIEYHLALGFDHLITPFKPLGISYGPLPGSLPFKKPTLTHLQPTPLECGFFQKSKACT